MNQLVDLQGALDSTLGYSERNRLTPEVRDGAINEALKIVYELLSTSNLIKAPATNVAVASGLATPPSDFNEGTVLWMGDSPTYTHSDEVLEVDEQGFGRWDNNDIDVFVQRYNTSTGALEWHFKGFTGGSAYVEYERGAPTLVNSTDYDGLPKTTIKATAKLASGILTDDILDNADRMQILLYGPTGNSSRYSPDSVMGILNRAMHKRAIRRQSGHPLQINLIDSKKHKNIILN